MFGRRADGRRVKNIDPIVKITPYLMPTRNDAMVQLKAEIPYEPMARYIAAKSAEGERFTFMNIIMASYVRAITQNPTCNRFILNKQTYARNSIMSCFNVLKGDPQNNDAEETSVKVRFDPMDTIYDVRDRMNLVIEANRGADEKNFLDKLVRVVFAVPGLVTVIVAIVKLLDRYGLLPKALIDELPFHTGMYITNNASIGLQSVYHHIYNFGTTSMFLGMGAIQRKTVIEDGVPKMKRFLPIGVTVDERITSGAHWSKLFADMLAGMKDPSILEKEPETIIYDDGMNFRIPKPVKK